MPPNMYRSLRLVAASLIVFCVFSALTIVYGNHQNRIRNLFYHTGNTTNQDAAKDFKVRPESLKDIANSTLGFEKVFVINLPERPDKLDQFVIISALSGFTADVIEGVKGSEVKNKSLPALEGLPIKESSRNNIVGCWRAHLNFAQTIVTNRLSSALVIEDDADWDTHLKDQLQEFAYGSQFVTGVTAGQEPHSPYGDDWDLLWLGHCSCRIKPDDLRRLVIENDATVPAPKRRANFGNIPNMNEEGYDNHTRVVYQANGGVCTYSYALSYRGALRYLRAQALRKTFTSIDVGISQMCGSKEVEFKCVGVFPQIIDSHKAAGRVSRDSDIGTFSPQEVRQKGYTFNIVHSIRLNMDRLLADKEAPIERQWPDDPLVVGQPRLRPIGRAVN